MKSHKHYLLLAQLGLLAVFCVGVMRAPDAAARPQYPEANAGWEEVGAGSATGGGISNTNGRSDSPSQAITPGGAPVVAWDDDRGDGEEIYVRTWNGSAWAEFGGSGSGGGISSTPGASTTPSVAVAADGAPIVAWEVSAGSDYEIYVRRWNGSSWVEMGGSASGGGISNNNGGSYSPSLVIGTDGAPIVAWYDASGGDWEIYVKRWSGSAWVEMGSGSAAGGGISNNSGSSRLPSLAIGPGGAPIIVWEDDSGGDGEIYARQWNGSAWVEMGSGSAAGGGISNNSGASIKPKLATGPGDAILVAWEDSSDGDAEIYARQWNGSAWVEMGSGSATGGGISNNSGNSGAPAPFIGTNSTTLIAWNDNSGSNVEAYVRRWNGIAWVEMDAGSASGGGISNNAGNSYSPVPVVAPDGRAFIVWADATSGNYEIYARSNPPVSTTCYSLTIAINGSGSVAAVPDLDCYEGGTQVTLTATPAINYAFTGWSGDLSGSANPAVLTMNGNKSVTAAFFPQPTCYTLSRSHTGSGGDPVASPSNSTGCGTGQYTAGQSISLAASPAAGWRVSGWSGTSNDASKETTNSLVMTAANSAVSVAYEPIPILCYTLSRSHTGSGGDPVASPSNSTGCGTGQYTVGQSISLAASPSAGWRVFGWSGTGNDASKEATNSLVMPAGNAAVSVAYEQIPIVCYILSRSHTGSGGDPVASPANSSGCSTGQYTAGQAISLTAAPLAGWSVSGWGGTANDNSQSTANSLIMPGKNHAVSVAYVFVPPPCYALSLSHNGNGADPTVDPPSSAGCAANHFTAGQAISLSAAPAAGWQVKNWGGTSDDAATTMTNSFVMPESNHAVSVTYEAIPVTCFSLSRSHTGSGGNPTATPANSTGCAAGRYIAGQAINLTAAPAAGWRVTGWSGTANNASTATTNSLTMPAAAHTVGVTYGAIPATPFRALAPLVVNVPLTCRGERFETEDNDSGDAANGPLCSGLTYTGLPDDVWDFYYFDTSRAAGIVVEMGNHTGGEVQLQLYYNTTAGRPLKFVTSGFRIDHPDAPAGRYYVAVYSYKPNPSSTTQYTLRATFAAQE